MKNLTELARKLRTNMTTQERAIWQLLRKRSIKNLKFRRQYNIDDKYIVDFICHEKKLIIEIDGGQHNEDINKVNDELRTKYLISKGFTVIRFWNSDIDKNIEGVYKEILRHLGG